MYKFLDMFSFGYIPRSGLAGPHGNTIYISEKLPECLTQQPHRFTFPCSSFSTSLLTLIINLHLLANTYWVSSHISL